MKKTMLMLGLMSVLITQSAVADIPETINLQGRLTDTAGNAVTDGTYGVTFTLHYQETGNTPTGWSEVQNISTQRGYFNVALGSNTSLNSLNFDAPYYLEIHVAGDAQPMTPRQPLASVPYAMRAKDGIPKGAIIMWTGASCPVGYRRVSELDGLFPRGATSYSGGQAGGALSHTHSGTTLSGGGSHTHHFTATSGGNSGYINIPRGTGANIDAAGSYHTHLVDGDTDATTAGHTHNFSTSSGDHTPAYFNIIFCIKE